MLDRKNEEALIRLRNDLVCKAINDSKIQEILLKYFPMRTTITITKDYYEINIPEDEGMLERLKRMGE